MDSCATLPEKILYLCRHAGSPYWPTTCRFVKYLFLDGACGFLMVLCRQNSSMLEFGVATIVPMPAKCFSMIIPSLRTCLYFRALYPANARLMNSS